MIWSIRWPTQKDIRLSLVKTWIRASLPLPQTKMIFSISVSSLICKPDTKRVPKGKYRSFWSTESKQRTTRRSVIDTPVLISLKIYCFVSVGKCRQIEAFGNGVAEVGRLVLFYRRGLRIYEETRGRDERHKRFVWTFITITILLLITFDFDDQNLQTIASYIWVSFRCCVCWVWPRGRSFTYGASSKPRSSSNKHFVWNLVNFKLTLFRYTQ